ncbi:MAG: helix-turn-helix transcriptional regulator [Bacillota bacterium]|nr:helix-turn-helix transcriptional regulator [Bacillota bacterium]
MAIILRLDRMMADRKISLNELAEKVGIANVNLSNIKTGKVSAIRFSTLNAICDVLDCQPGDLLEFQRDEGGK